MDLAADGVMVQQPLEGSRVHRSNGPLGSSAGALGKRIQEGVPFLILAGWSGVHLDPHLLL